MLTLFVIYSPDRLEHFKIALSCLEEMDDYHSCQKILCVDGRTNIFPRKWEVIEIPRKGYFNWSRMWDAALDLSVFEKILYLDADRILAKDFLAQVYHALDEFDFVYSSQLFHMRDFQSLEIIREIRDQKRKIENYAEEDVRLPHFPDFENSGVIYGKNPFSGNLGFHKSVYWEIGGIDPGCEGYGFPDTDIYWRCRDRSFYAIPCQEIHLNHPYREERRIRALMNLYNASRFCKKFSLQPSESLREIARKHGFRFDRNYGSLGECLKIFSRFSQW